MALLGLFEVLSLLVLFAWLFFFVIQAYNMTFKGYAPFISSRKKYLKKILDNFEIEPEGVIYELGCGRAGFLKRAKSLYPKARLVGYEYAFLPFLTAKIQNWLNKSKLDIRKKDIFKVDLREADVIYCYLNPKMMLGLKNKFRQELRPGTKIISYQFKIPNFEPYKVVAGGKIADKIYFYER